MCSTLRRITYWVIIVKLVGPNLLLEVLLGYPDIYLARLQLVFSYHRLSNPKELEKTGEMKEAGHITLSPYTHMISA